MPNNPQFTGATQRLAQDDYRVRNSVCMSLLLRIRNRRVFADSYSAWRRGMNENTIGLIRQYIKKWHDLNQYIDEYISKNNQRFNNRPRKRLGFKSPSQVLLQQQDVALQMLI